MDDLIYFDNAATTFPKPACVKEVIHDCISHYCANPGRSSHRLSIKASESVYLCRERLADFFGGEPENTVFTSSATHSVNLALKSFLKQGEHVLISDFEHNAVLRPIAALSEKGLITYDFYRSDLEGEELECELRSKVKNNTTLICACHRSNVCSLTSKIADIGRFCQKNGIFFLVDASQSAGILQLDSKCQGIDFLCAPAHKGLYGIPGCGFVILSERAVQSGNLTTFTEGGNGVDSLSPFMPEALPEKFEAGTLPLPAICGLSAGIDFVSKIGIEGIRRHEDRLCAITSYGLSKIKRIKIHSGSGVVLFSVNGIPSEGFAYELAKRGICVRAGLHCAPLAHKRLETLPDGAVRISFSAFNSEKEVKKFLDTCKALL